MWGENFKFAWPAWFTVNYVAQIGLCSPRFWIILTKWPLEKTTKIEEQHVSVHIWLYPSLYDDWQTQRTESIQIQYQMYSYSSLLAEFQYVASWQRGKPHAKLRFRAATGAANLQPTQSSMLKSPAHTLTLLLIQTSCIQLIVLGMVF